jgi:hypothetical protein
VAEGLNDTQKKIEDTINKLEDRLKHAKSDEQWDRISARIERLQAGLNRSKQGVAGSQLEETYHDDDEFFEAYGVMEYNDEMINEAEYQGRKVTLNKPMQGDIKKFKVYTKNAKGNVIKVNFGDKNSTIKKHIPGRRANFRARHNCDTAKDKTTARYWSCKKW